jgi:diaminopimelate decarboxylase
MIKKSLEHHSPLNFYDVEDHCLVIGKQKFTDILSHHKDVPAYIYDSSVIKQKIDSLRDILPESMHIHYAIKANPMPEVVNYVQGLVEGLDVASGLELKIALASGMNPKEISFAGPGKNIDELTFAIKSGITINLESETELDRAAEIGEKLGITPRVALRINPDFELKTSGMKMSGGPKQFGVDAEIANDIIKKIISYRLDFIGLHIFSGSQNLKHEALIEAQTKTFALAADLAEQSGAEFSKLNIGGGFGIPYFPGEKPLPLEPIGENLHLLLDQYADRFGDADIITELGRFIVGESGVYISKVIDKKISRGSTFLIINGGLHHHLAASGNFGQVIRKNYPVTVANKIGLETEKASAVGPLCTPLDVLAQDMDLPKAEIGDYVAVFNSGAYGYTSSPLNFLSHPHPIEIFI